MDTDNLFGNKLVKLGLNIAYYRKLKLFTQQQLADKVDVDRSYISKIEAPNMFTSISLELLCKIADVLEVSEDKLFEFKKTVK